MFSVADAIKVLERTPATLRAWLGGLDGQWVYGDYGAGTFNPFEVVGHLIHGERADWMARVRIILEHGESRAFDPFDRYAQFEACAGKSLAQLLDEFASLRAANLTALAALKLTPSQLALRGRHPALGVVTLENLIATWAAHDLNHLAQIARAQAAQIGDAVGPWREYLSILRLPATPMDEEGRTRQVAARARQTR